MKNTTATTLYGKTYDELVAQLDKAHKAGGFGHFGTIAAAKGLKAAKAELAAEFGSRYCRNCGSANHTFCNR